MYAYTYYACMNACIYVCIYTYVIMYVCIDGDLYNPVGGKPLLGCFTRMFTVREISNAQDYQSSIVSTVF